MKDKEIIEKRISADFITVEQWDGNVYLSTKGMEILWSDGNFCLLFFCLITAAKKIAPQDRSAGLR
jgi:hypothetical protein